MIQLDGIARGKTQARVQMILKSYTQCVSKQPYSWCWHFCLIKAALTLFTISNRCDILIRPNMCGLGDTLKK